MCKTELSILSISLFWRSCLNWNISKNFSIAHLYGEAGSRKNYSAHGCQAIMGRSSSPREQLVCPFAVDDVCELTDNKLGLVQVSSDPQKNCAYYLNVLCQRPEQTSDSSLKGDGELAHRVPTGNQVNHEIDRVVEDFAFDKPSHFFRILLRYQESVSHQEPLKV